MPKTTDVPVELREFNHVFEKIAYHHGYGEVFTDFIDYAIACFLDTGDVEKAKQLQQRYGDCYPDFQSLMREWMQLHHKMLNRGKKWYDALGAFYEVISSTHKASALGQFFTPPDVVDFLTIITGEQKAGPKARMNDPCSGSGRMLIAFHAHFPGNYTFAGDIDPICAKMTALNMMLHGCEGQAVCIDSLHPDDWRFGFAINPYIRVVGIPHIVRIQKEQCLQWQQYQHDKQEFAKKKAQAEEAAKIATTTVKEAPTVGKFGQLSFL